MAGFEERFEVRQGGELIGFFPTYDYAWAVAGLAFCKRPDAGDSTIYDRMAHRGRPLMWRHDGKVLSIRR